MIPIDGEQNVTIKDYGYSKRMTVKEWLDSSTVEGGIPITSQWIPDPAWRWVHLYKCKRCEYSHPMDYDKPDWIFCPMCGAKMEGEW